MSARSRTYGHDFERFVASEYRKKWPAATVRRSLQSRAAYEPDVVVEGGPLWTECAVGAAVNPEKKLLQAERDVARCGAWSLPIVVWRRKGERTVWVTTRNRTWLALTVRSPDGPPDACGAELTVTVPFKAFLSVLP